MIRGTDATLELKIRSMEHAIVQAFTLYEGKLNDEIKDLVHSVVVGFDFKGELEEEIKRTVKNELRIMCQEAMGQRLRQMLHERINKAIAKLDEK